MKIALTYAKKGMNKKEGGPFGACIVKGNKIVAAACNQVLKHNDATCHAEINAIRQASLKISDFDLSGHVIYTTTEPCPMCFSAIHWARLKTVTYSTVIADVKRLGFNELTISNPLMKRWGKSPVKLRRVKSDACKALLAEWAGLNNKKTY